MVEYMRQMGLMCPSTIEHRSVSIIGVGATGSHVALYLAQMGWGNENLGQGVMKLYDYDVVEAHNIANQAFDIGHVGMKKVDAMNEIIFRKCGFRVQANDMKVVDQYDVRSDYVFLLTDTMSSRCEIFEKILKTSFSTKLVIETRMGLREGRIYTFNPCVTSDVNNWKSTLYKDEEAEVSACGASESIATTAVFISAIAAGRVIQHFNTMYGLNNLGTDKNSSVASCWNEFQFGLYPESFYVRDFGGNPQTISK